MKKILQVGTVIMLLSFGTTLYTHAQSKVALEAGANFGQAARDPYKFALGGDLRLQAGLGSNCAKLIVGSGVTHFFKREATPGYTYLPLKLGLKTYLIGHLYATGEIGAAFHLSNNGGTSFMWTPSVGYTFSDIDFSVKYESLTRYTHLRQYAIRLAYRFAI